MESRKQDAKLIKGTTTRLNRSGRDYQQIINDLDVGYFLVGLDGIILDHNRAFNRIFGIDISKDLIGSIYFNFWQEEKDRKEFIQALMKDGSVKNYIFPAKKIDGEKIIVLGNTHLIRDEEGLPIASEGTIIDITKTKKAEDLLKKENRKLKKMDRFRKDFINRATHRLKNPLTTIFSAAQLIDTLHHDKLTVDELDLLDIILTHSLKLKKYINELLDVSRLDSGDINLNKKEENLSEMIKEIIDCNKTMIKDRHLSLDHDIEGGLLLEIDKKRVEQVISNLISNAIKNTYKNGRILVQLKRLDGKIEFSVKDTGVGITKSERKKLFKQFSRIERPELDIINEGTGLGLYISKEIVNSHGGQIFVESDGRDKGSTFIVQLPSIK